MEVIRKLAHRSNYGSVRYLTDIKYIVIHYTGNDGDKSYNNANYFANNANLKASAHYFVDDNYIFQSVPDNYTAYSVGANSADRSKGGGRFFGKCTNKNSINIELCDTNKNRVIYPTEATIQKAIELCLYLMNDIVNLIINSSTSVVIIAYFIFRDYKWNQQLISTLTKIEKILDDMSERSQNGKK